MDDALVGFMEGAMSSAAAGTPFEVEVWPHGGVKAGARTSVQAWARSERAMKAVNDDPELMLGLLSRTGIPHTRKSIYIRKDGTARVATQAQIANWTRGGGGGRGV